MVYEWLNLEYSSKDKVTLVNHQRNELIEQITSKRHTLYLCLNRLGLDYLKAISFIIYMYIYISIPVT